MNCLAIRFPELSKQWHPTKNGVLKPEDVSCGSAKNVCWLCPKTCDYGCVHEWIASIKSRTRGSGCPYCCECPKKICFHQSLSFTHPELSKQWHPTKNGVLKPEDVSCGSAKNVCWLCPKTCDYGCVHEYEQAVKDKTDGHGCPYCCECPKKICFHQSLSFTHPELSKQWHPTKNGVLKPEDVSCGSAKKVWWVCDVNCTHIWDASIKSRTRGRGCSKCAKKFSKMGIEWVNYVAETEKIKIRHALCDEDEFRIPGTLYRADGYCQENNTIYEFNGSIFHGDSRDAKYDADKLIHGITMKERYNDTQKKKQKIIELGYNYVEMWEYDWRRAIKAIIKIQRIWKSK